MDKQAENLNVKLKRTKLVTLGPDSAHQIESWLCLCFVVWHMKMAKSLFPVQMGGPLFLCDHCVNLLAHHYYTGQKMAMYW